MTRFCCFLLLCFLSLLQFIAVLFAVGGIVLFAYEDSFGSAGWLGVLLSLGSALGAALYKVLVSGRLLSLGSALGTALVGRLLSLGSIVVSRYGLGAYSKPHLQLQEVST